MCPEFQFVFSKGSKHCLSVRLFKCLIRKIWNKISDYTMADLGDTATAKKLQEWVGSMSTMRLWTIQR